MGIQAEIRHALTGAIPSISTPFARDGKVDEEGLRNCIEFNLNAGAKAIVLTAGDSHYIALGDDEIAQVTKLAAEIVNGRAILIAADRAFHTRKALSFAKECKALGADVLMLMPPDWAKSTTPRTLAEHYAEVAKQMPVMIVTNVFLPRGEAFALETLELAFDASENIVSVKDDMCGPFARKLAAQFHERASVWSGEQKQNHLNMAPYGGTGYLSSFISFKPEVAHAYWKAWTDGNVTEAARITHEIDMPFFDAVSACPGGFDAGVHGTMELFGICNRWRPKPYHSLTDEELDALARRLSTAGIL